MGARPAALLPELAGQLADARRKAADYGAYLGWPRRSAVARASAGASTTTTSTSGSSGSSARGYAANLVSSWIPALDGVEAKLRAGVTVADVGCGHGASTILLAQAFPNSTVVGFDNHPPSIEAARVAAEKAGVADLRFRRAVDTPVNRIIEIRP